MASPEEQTAAMIGRLPELTGRSLDEWKALIGKSGITAHGKLVAMLKDQHGVSHGYANLIVHKTLKSDADSVAGDVDLVGAQYAGARAAVKPLYDAVLSKVTAFGADVEVAPKKAYVSLRRAKQFAILQPAAGRLDVGIKLPGAPTTGRLEASGSFNSMVSHRVRVASVDEVDAELVGWLRTAYAQAG
jgi:hypothetical protein